MEVNRKQAKDGDVNRADSFGQNWFPSGEILETVVSTMHEGVCVQDASGQIIASNPAAWRILGLQKDDLNGRTHMDPRWRSVDEKMNDLPGEQHPSMRALRTGLPVIGGIIGIERPNGELRWLRTNSKPIQNDADCVPSMVVTTFTDITDDMMRVDTLKEQATSAKAAAEAKQMLLSNISHEIRTPLTAILGLAQSLSNSPLTAEQKEQVEAIVASGDGLLQLLNDLLDLTRMEAGKFVITPTNEQIALVIRQQINLWRPQADRKGLPLTLSFEDNVPEHLCFDAARVQQCVSNLLSNAIKFTKSGGIHVSVGTHLRSDGSHTVNIRVRDTGIGMDSRTVDRVFKPFETSAKMGFGNYGGTGLGLPLVRRLAHLMDGEVHVESAPGRGSEFTLCFTAGETYVVKSKRKKHHSARLQLAEMLSDMTALVVDDQPLNRMLCRIFLEPYGITTIEAENGIQALQRLEDFSVDFVLLDMHMPEMDGPDTVEAIRQSRENWADVPVIALTADAMNGVREYCRSVGMDGYLTKPLIEKDFLREMAQVLGTEIHVDDEPLLNSASFG